MSQLTDLFDPNQSAQLAQTQEAKAGRASREGMQQREIASRQAMQQEDIASRQAMQAQSQDFEREQNAQSRQLQKDLQTMSQGHSEEMAILSGNINKELRNLDAELNDEAVDKQALLDAIAREADLKMENIIRKQNHEVTEKVIETLVRGEADRKTRVAALKDSGKSLTNQISTSHDTLSKNLRLGATANLQRFMSDKGFLKGALKHDTSLIGEGKKFFGFGEGFGEARDFEFFFPNFMTKVDTTVFPEREEGSKDLNVALERMAQLSLKERLSADEQIEYDELVTGNNGLDGSIFQSLVSELNGRFSTFVDPNQVKALATSIGAENINVDNLTKMLVGNGSKFSALNTKLKISLQGKILPTITSLQGKYGALVRNVENPAKYKGMSREEIRNTVTENHETLTDGMPPSVVKILDKQFINEIDTLVEYAYNAADPDTADSKLGSILDVSNDLLEELAAEQVRTAQERVNR